MINKYIMDLIDIAICSEGAHYDVAKVVHNLYKGNNKDLDLRIALSENISRKFAERATYYNNLLMNTNDEGRKEVFNKKATAALKITLKLKMTGCKYLFRNEK